MNNFQQLKKVGLRVQAWLNRYISFSNYSIFLIDYAESSLIVLFTVNYYNAHLKTSSSDKG